MTSSDGYILGVEKIVNNVPNDKGFNIVILNDGFTLNELNVFRNTVNFFISYLKTLSPFNDYWDIINVHRIDVVSNESGVKDPTPCEGYPRSGANPKTYFDATMCFGGVHSYVYGDYNLVNYVSAEYVPEGHGSIVIVNTTDFGATGAPVIWTTIFQDFYIILVHEMGHLYFNLADEYTEYGQYLGSIEPLNPNVTINTDRNTLKWKNLVLPETPIPTLQNEPGYCNQLPCGTSYGNIVGLFEGASYSSCGIYRAQCSCKMRSAEYDFCAVCKQAISQTLEQFRTALCNQPTCSFTLQ